MNDVGITPSTRPGRNDPCWCGSGQKYKKCHLDADARGESAGPPPRPSRARLQPGKVTPRRAVPAHIPRPDYATTGRPRAQGGDVKTPAQLERLRRASRAAARVLRITGEAVRVGLTTDALDEIAHAETIRLGGYPSPLNYRGYPKSLCTSVNEVICHGIPDNRPLEDGDIVNLDVTVYLDGMHGDCSATFLVGEVDAPGRRLVEAARECLAKGIAVVRPGRPISEIGKVIEAHASRHGFGVVRAYCGHGIGESFHTDAPDPAPPRPEREAAHGAGDDVHDRADDHRGRLGRRALERRLDRRHRGREALRPTASNWAERFPSAVTAVQPSFQSASSQSPSVIIGSIVNVIPGSMSRFTLGSWWCGIWSVVWKDSPMPWPQYARTTPKPWREACASITLPISEMGRPGRTTAIPFARHSRAASTSRRPGASTSPTRKVAEQSPCMPSR